MEAPPTKTSTIEDKKTNDEGTMELDISPAATRRRLGSQVPRIRTRDEQEKKQRRQQQMRSFFPQQASFDRSTVSMGRKIVKKALKIRQKMENKDVRNRTYALLERLCQEQKDNQNTDDNKNVEYEEPPPRPPTRRCMFYRDDNEQPKSVLRVKQL